MSHEATGAMGDDGELGGGASTAPLIAATSAAHVSLRSLRQQYAREVKRKVPPPQNSGTSDSETDSEDEFDAMHFGDSESSEELIAEDEEELSGDVGQSRSGPKTYVCEDCGFRASKPALLAQHKRVHSDQSCKPPEYDAVKQALQHRITSELRS